jgi:hypothetical protein
LVGAVFAVHAVAAPGLTALGADGLGVAVGYEGIEIVVDAHDDIAAAAAVATVRAAHGAVFFVQKARAAIAALTRFYFD